MIGVNLLTSRFRFNAFISSIFPPPPLWLDPRTPVLSAISVKHCLSYLVPPPSELSDSTTNPSQRIAHQQNNNTLGYLVF